MSDGAMRSHGNSSLFIIGTHLGGERTPKNTRVLMHFLLSVRFAKENKYRFFGIKDGVLVRE